MAVVVRNKQSHKTTDCFSVPAHRVRSSEALYQQSRQDLLQHSVSWSAGYQRPSVYSVIVPACDSEVDKLIWRAPCKHCPLDPVPTWLVKRAIDVLAPVITTICNASLQSGCFPNFYKQARVTARLKKPSLNPDDLNSFRPISNSFL